MSGEGWELHSRSGHERAEWKLIETRRARAALEQDLPLDRHVDQSMRLAGFLSACHSGDLGLMRRSMVDLVAEPVRSGLIPGYAAAKTAALDLGAIGFGIAGWGPSVFALVAAEKVGQSVREAVVGVFESEGIESDDWVGSVRGEGAGLVPTSREAGAGREQS